MLPTSGRRRLPGLLVMAIFSLLFAGSGCVHSKTRRAESARASGELAQADLLLQRASRRGRSKTREAAGESLLDLRAERLALVATLHEAALAVESRQEVPIAEELAWYEAALTLSLPDDPSFEAISARIEELRADQLDRLQAHSRAEKALAAARSCASRDLDGELRELVSLAYLADVEPPSTLAWELAEICFEAARYDQAASLSERARRLEAYHHVPPPCADSLLRLALSLHRTGVKGPLVAAVSVPDPKIESASASDPPVVRARPAQPRPGRARPAPPPAGRGTQPSRIASAVDAEAAEVSDAANESSEIQPEPEPEPEPEPAPPTPEARNALSSARRLHGEGDVHGALILIDQSFFQLADHPERRLLGLQRDDWAPERAELVRSYLARAEAALAAQRPDEAAGLYERILALEPDHAVSRDRLRRLEHLRSLREP